MALFSGRVVATISKQLGINAPQISCLSWPASKLAKGKLHVSCSNRATGVSSILEEKILGSPPKINLEETGRVLRIDDASGNVNDGEGSLTSKQSKTASFIDTTIHQQRFNNAEDEKKKYRINVAIGQIQKKSTIFPATAFVSHSHLGCRKYSTHTDDCDDDDFDWKGCTKEEAVAKYRHLKLECSELLHDVVGERLIRRQEKPRFLFPSELAKGIFEKLNDSVKPESTSTEPGSVHHSTHTNDDLDECTKEDLIWKHRYIELKYYNLMQPSFGREPIHIQDPPRSRWSAEEIELLRQYRSNKTKYDNECTKEELIMMYRDIESRYDELLLEIVGKKLVCWLQPRFRFSRELAEKILKKLNEFEDLEPDWFLS